MSNNIYKKQPKFTLSTSSDYKDFFSSGVLGGMSPADCRIIFFVDRLQPEMVPERAGRMRISNLKRELLAEVHMTPVQFKTMANWMNRHIQQYERRFGVISAKKDESEPPSGLIS